jgi:transposase
MHVVVNKSNSGKKIYQSILLRESYRENGNVRKRTIANLSNCKPEEIAAIKLALKHKDDLTILGSLKESVDLQESFSVGAVWAVYQVAKELGIEKVLGNNHDGKLAFWQVIARVIDQGSRLSAVRLAQTHAACDVLKIERGFDEDDLYDNLKWLAQNQECIEDKLFKARRNKGKPQLFLYDVTSSYLEGEHNYFGEYGYSRDKKKGKKQIVIGLLCDEYGEPVSTEVFAGNTQDPKTFASQVRKVAKRFGCKHATFVGDRGMIKSVQIANLPEDFYYITAITKPQIRSLKNKGIIQMELFDQSLCEVIDDGVRYILRCNPVRSKEMSETRSSKRRIIDKFVAEKNTYLRDHPRAIATVAVRNIEKKIECLKLNKWLKVKENERVLSLEQDDEVLKEESILDGCYIVKTNLPLEAADKQIVHDRYRDLAEVERAFRDCKTVSLEVRPVYVRKKESTCGHVLVVMLGYMITRKLRHAWIEFDLTVEEGLKQLTTLCSTEVKVKGQASCLKIPRPREKSRDLLKAINVRMPNALPHRDVRVVTRKKLTERRKVPIN